MLSHLDLFSGIGGFALAARMVGGYETVGFCEIEPYCQAVLRKRWPGVRVFDDVRSLRAADVGPVDVLTGGFPCQDISLAGRGAGLGGERSGLWSELHRIIDEARPRFALIENVPALRSRGLDTVLGQLAQIGYDAEWHCFPASAVGAPHRRDRIWIVADADLARSQGWIGEVVRERAGEWTARAGGSCRRAELWQSEPDVGRVAHGIPARVDRLRGLGNAIVPQVAAIFLEAIKRVSECDTSRSSK